MKKIILPFLLCIIAASCQTKEKAKRDWLCTTEQITSNGIIYKTIDTFFLEQRTEDEARQYENVNTWKRVHPWPNGLDTTVITNKTICE